MLRLRMVLGGAAMVLVAGHGLAVGVNVKDNPYQVIAAHNPFRLAPQPINPVKPASSVVQTPRPLVRLAGLIDVGGAARVLVEVTSAGSTVPDRFVARAGDEVGGVRILQVDVRTARAKVRAAGEEMLLNLGPLPGGARKGG